MIVYILLGRTLNGTPGKLLRLQRIQLRCRTVSGYFNPPNRHALASLDTDMPRQSLPAVLEQVQHGADD
ncbi:hypothetical protein E2P81_ATG09961 [Venturia nashicola]|uniref:Uncharacterized protein n=1 Tax=Venturia nashicola TaxID=86259 RepID=A0A4Z1NHP4_9PEZI|nr:hypothetical protein E6O75_ATG10180 [Venturia nashicola]TLD18663.1 hypothetical protein E2P81_ATG09961 [Venturia nashicola]